MVKKSWRDANGPDPSVGDPSEFSANSGELAERMSRLPDASRGDAQGARRC